MARFIANDACESVSPRREEETHPDELAPAVSYLIREITCLFVLNRGPFRRCAYILKACLIFDIYIYRHENVIRVLKCKHLACRSQAAACRPWNMAPLQNDILTSVLVQMSIITFFGFAWLHLVVQGIFLSAPLPRCASQCTLVPSPPVLEHSGDFLTLHWQLDPTAPSNGSDKIALYAPPFKGDSASEKDWVAFFKPSEIAQHSEHSLPLTNVRAPFYDIRYLSGVTGECLCRADKVTFRMGPEEPTQGHTTVDTVTGALKVHWVSGDPTPAKLWFKEEGSDTWYSTQAKTTTYTSDDMCNATLDKYYHPGYFHTAVLPTDVHGTLDLTYGKKRSLGQQMQVKAPIMRGQRDEYSVALFGDMGVQGLGRGPYKLWVPHGVWDSYWVQEHMRINDRLRLMVHFGDISYADGYSRVWDIFGDVLQDVTMRNPVMVSDGNHDYDYKGAWNPSWAKGDFIKSKYGNECGVPLKHRYDTPAWWYSFDYGMVHYVMLSSEHNWTEGSNQWEWFSKDLSEVDRTVTPWVVVTSHRPMLVAVIGEPRNTIESHMAKELMPLLKEYKVNLYVAGHWHHYERTKPVDETVHVLSGCAGAQDLPVKFRDLNRTAAIWAEVRGYLELQVKEDSLVGIFWGVNDTMEDRHLIEFDHFMINNRDQAVPHPLLRGVDV
ncbi:hypothetical protein FOL47_001762 [Perkinsus chesapeaki]|uniref:Purple acid phosphatase n=1 Tax=Perkinsus chesapeaki TaxID=330153 RepID=A0A7J6KR24_PERCH|nr:hypothetical protein FOL47_001762 [Perkinsus chesapeaki]